MWQQQHKIYKIYKIYKIHLKARTKEDMAILFFRLLF